MLDPANAKLDAAQLDAFYSSLQGYDIERRDPLPPIVHDLLEDVATGTILPDLGNGWADSVGDRQKDSGNWSEISRVFRRKLESFISGGPENRLEVLSVIYETVLTRAKILRFHGRHQATRYFARSAANRVQRLIDPAWKKNAGDTREWMRAPDSWDVITGTNREPTSLTVGPQRNHVAMSRPESNAERYLLHESLRRSLPQQPAEQGEASEADCWVVLNLLVEDGGYRYAEIVAALHVPWPDRGGVEQLRNLQDLCALAKDDEAEEETTPDGAVGVAGGSGKGDRPNRWEYSEQEYMARIARIRTLIEQDDAWSHPDRAARPLTNARPAPRHPLQVWNDLREGYSLPGYLPATKMQDAVCRWMPPPTLTEGNLRVFYCRGLKKLKRCFASDARLL